MTPAPLNASDEIAFSQVICALCIQIREVSRSAEIIEEAALNVLKEAVIPNTVALQRLDLLRQQLADAEATLSFVLNGAQGEMDLPLSSLLDRLTLEENRLRFVRGQNTSEPAASVELF